MSFPQPQNSDGFTLVVTTTVQPGKMNEFLECFWKAVKLASAEPECLSFEVFRYPDEPNKLKWVENWSKSKEWFFEVWIPDSRFPSNPVTKSAFNVSMCIPTTWGYILDFKCWRERGGGFEITACQLIPAAEPNDQGIHEDISGGVWSPS
jgi:hypothetical protein